MADGKRPTLDVEDRPERGTRAAKRLRREGYVPGVVYGGKDGDCTSFKVNWRDLRQVLAGSALIDLKVGGKTRPVIVKDQQQHPVRDELLHIDLLEVRLDEKIQTQVSVHLEGAEEAPGIKEGGVLEHVTHQLNIEAQSQRAFARGYRRHPFIYVPDVVTRLSTERVLVSEWVDGAGFDEVRELPQPEKDRFGEIVFRFCFGSIYHLQHFNADAHPGNYLVVSGRPTPTRTRAKSPLPSPRLSDFSPLWPASPPPVRTSIFPNGRSISSWIATTWSRSTPSAPRAGPTELPDSFMYVCGSRTATRFPSA